MITLSLMQIIVTTLMAVSFGALWTFLLVDYQRVGAVNELKQTEEDLAHVERELDAAYALLERRQCGAEERLAS